MKRHRNKGRACCMSTTGDRHVGTHQCGRQRRHDLFRSKTRDCACWTCVRHSDPHGTGLDVPGGREVLFLCGGCGAELRR